MTIRGQVDRPVHRLRRDVVLRQSNIRVCLHRLLWRMAKACLTPSWSSNGLARRPSFFANNADLATKSRQQESDMMVQCSVPQDVLGCLSRYRACSFRTRATPLTAALRLAKLPEGLAMAQPMLTGQDPCALPEGFSNQAFRPRCPAIAQRSGDVLIHQQRPPGGLETDRHVVEEMAGCR